MTDFRFALVSVILTSAKLEGNVEIKLSANGCYVALHSVITHWQETIVPR